jgi:hypothetical protein
MIILNDIWADLQNRPKLRIYKTTIVLHDHLIPTD